MTSRNDKPGDLYASSRVTTSAGSKLRVVDDKCNHPKEYIYGDGECDFPIHQCEECDQDCIDYNYDCECDYYEPCGKDRSDEIEDDEDDE